MTLKSWCLCRWLTPVLALSLGGCATAQSSNSTAVRTPTSSPVASAPAHLEPTSAPLAEAPYTIAPGYEKTYVVFGRRYFTLSSADGYQAQGTASWYGPKFDGRPTANGETFDMHQMTAAHKSLPLPTFARVTNLSNNRTIVVRINDRGPFVGERLIDLSYAAAVALDMIGPGTAEVSVTALNAADSTQHLLVPEATITSASQPVVNEIVFIQVGAFSDRTNASKLVQQLEQSGFSDVLIETVNLDDRVLHRVKIGPLSGAESHNDALSRLGQMGLNTAKVVSQ